jgi:dTDP-3-amino-3,4,6-trideoxy-alpha-D-glucose transaminase
VRRVFDSGRFVLGDEVAAFEEAFASYCGVNHCIGVGSGTDALVLALRACGIGIGDEVIVPAFGFVATAFAVRAVGAEPVLVDVREDSALLDIDRVASVTAGSWICPSSSSCAVRTTSF